MSRSASAPSSRVLPIDIAQTYQQLKLLRKMVEQAEDADRSRPAFNRKRHSLWKNRTHNGQTNPSDSSNDETVGGVKKRTSLRSRLGLEARGRS